MAVPTRTDAQAKRLGESFVRQARLAADWLAALPSQPPAAATDLVGHLLFLLTDVGQTLNQPTNQRPVDLAAHLRTLRANGSRLHELTARTIGHESAVRLIAQVRPLVDDLEGQLGAQLPPVVASLFEPVRTADFLRACLIDLLLQCDDAARLGPATPLALDPQALIDAVRGLGAALEAEHAGRSVELRVPPAIAVQLAAADGPGPTHTRGTPPTVVETDPRTLLRLCGGRLAWADAVRTHAVAASGAHADLGRLFPMV